ncbi:prolipoprotein diacylglyceryl transferase [Mycobacterium kyorinense]|uniref:Phosphatidylglycerol--prolipoprotein diacylglyceryl transferase n=1 Tax=Mycobacterium kyorinense TaxID=487514 RepID=A0A1A2ZNB3_9MYCO|nr:prolipoprotein diacylglyceryl transferase [Mycobacterium kyorinense]OBI50957.1 prolipoprotein diacylglyceryl transferase [Mycobacterium kyorinense]
MTTTVLAYFPSPPRGVWHLGPVPIRAYALFIIIGIVAALVIGDRRWVARGGERGVIYDIALWAVPSGLIGGRLYHLATDWRTYFGEAGAGLGAAFRIWDGGLGIWGAVALGGVGAWIGCRHRGIPLPAFADAVAPGIVLAQAIGRLGNYFNQELYGRETTLPWGLEIFYRQDPAGFTDVHSLDGVSTGELAMIVHPTFLYELLWNVLVFVALIYLDRRFRIGHGRLFALYVAGYCFGRFCVELLRDDIATHIAGIRINSFTATFVFIGAVVYLILAPKGREDLAVPAATAAELAPVGSASTAAPAADISEPVDSVEPAPAAEAEAVGAEELDTAAQPTEEAEAVAAAAEEAEADAAVTEVAADAELPESDAEEAEAEEVEEAEAEPEPESEVEAEEPEAEESEPAVAAEAEAETDVEEPELGEVEEAEAETDVEEPELDETEAEAEDAEAETEPEDIEAEEPEAEEEEEAEAEEPEAEEEEEPESADVAAEEAEEPVPDMAEPASPTPTGWRSRLSRLRRRSAR